MKNLVLLLLCWLCTGTAIAQTVYKPPSGQKYHLANCRMVKNVSTQTTMPAAEAAGLEPCKICRPGQAGLPSTSATPAKAKGTSQTVQCQGYTKAGSRCKHKTKIGNGFCFQHQPG